MRRMTSAALAPTARRTASLPGSLPHQVRQHAEDAHGGQEGRHTRKQPNHLRAKPRIRQCVREQFLHGLELDGHSGIRVVQERAKRAGERLLVQRGPSQDGQRLAPALRRWHEEHRRRRLTRILPPGVGDNPDDLHPRRPAIRPVRIAVQAATRLERRCVPGSR